MVQQFQVLRCCRCQTFQVHQVKKAKKWACKLCAQKQSYIKVYGQGSGAECRQHVQKLNLLRGEADNAAPHQKEAQLSTTLDPVSCVELSSKGGAVVVPSSGSRWQQYLTPAEEEDVTVEPDDFGLSEDAFFTTDRQLFDTTNTNQRKQQRVERSVGRRKRLQEVDEMSNASQLCAKRPMYEASMTYRQQENNPICVKSQQGSNFSRKGAVGGETHHSPHSVGRSSSSYISANRNSVRTDNLVLAGDAQDEQSTTGAFSSKPEALKERAGVKRQNKMARPAPPSTSKWAAFMNAGTVSEESSSADEDDLFDDLRHNSKESAANYGVTPRGLSTGPCGLHREAGLADIASPTSGVGGSANASALPSFEAYTLFSTEDDLDDIIGNV